MLKTNKILDRINTMLDNAISGKEIEKTFDESKASQIESKLHKYLLSTGKSKELIEEQKLRLDSLVSDISHQTKTPISNISLYSELISESDNDEDRKKYSEMLINQAEKLNFLVNSLVKTSRLESGIISVNPKSQSIKPLLKYLADSFPNVEISPNESQAVFDLKWTCEALTNIVDNAIKYGASKIEISVTSFQLFLKIDVSDNGRGIAEDEIPKVFERFYRGVDNTNCDGVGIGLYLSREIISKQGGYIKVSSLKNQGSVFSVYLPLE